ncbi:unnamed protein product [Microthlaspi erraticum]|uniref:non-specific serine/threonine protein kinase n=1 Tax=Microthlaspi erraticum TaxID=1685480 RepID=A0A6D2IU24_9BRAS|nr:unnamed protein product [Microthlaspi erraticum]
MRRRNGDGGSSFNLTLTNETPMPLHTAAKSHLFSNSGAHRRRHHLFSISISWVYPEQIQISLDWPTRMKICLGIARGLAYIHEDLRLKILHRYIKAANILLDKKLSPKISDFGLAKQHDEKMKPNSIEI